MHFVSKSPWALAMPQGLDILLILVRIYVSVPPHTNCFFSSFLKSPIFGKPWNQSIKIVTILTIQSHPDLAPRFWSFLLSGRDPISEIPIERFDVDELFDEDRGVPGKVYVREGGFIPGVEDEILRDLMRMNIEKYIFLGSLKKNGNVSFLELWIQASLLVCDVLGGYVPS